MSYDIDNTPITTTISPKVARFIATQLEPQFERSDMPVAIRQQFRAAIDSLVLIGVKYDDIPQPWTLSLADMRSALTWIVRIVQTMQQGRDKFKLDQQTRNALDELDPMYEEFSRIGRETAKQIVAAGDVEFGEFLRNVAPGFMMETEHGVDPLQGTAGLCPKQ